VTVHRENLACLHASHAKNGNQSELLVSTHVEPFDQKDRKEREAEVANCKYGRHSICECYYNVHANACTVRSQGSSPEVIDWAALEHGEETVDHTHHHASIYNDVSDATERPLEDGRIAEQ
jgi:hypothetical protein